MKKMTNIDMIVGRNKTLTLSGLCINCTNALNCEFLKKTSLSARESDIDVLDYELSVYSCDMYNTDNEESVDNILVCECHCCRSLKGSGYEIQDNREKVIF